MPSRFVTWVNLLDRWQLRERLWAVEGDGMTILLGCGRCWRRGRRVRNWSLAPSYPALTVSYETFLDKLLVLPTALALISPFGGQ